MLDDAQGVLQDVRWSQGSFGYFLGYALGTTYAAHMVHEMHKDVDFDECCATGQLQPILDYQAKHLWKYGMMRIPDILIRQACSGEFAPFFVQHLENKYSDVYKL